MSENELLRKRKWLRHLPKGISLPAKRFEGIPYFYKIIKKDNTSDRGFLYHLGLNTDTIGNGFYFTDDFGVLNNLHLGDKIVKISLPEDEMVTIINQSNDITLHITLQAKSIIVENIIPIEDAYEMLCEHLYIPKESWDLLMAAKNKDFDGIIDAINRTALVLIPEATVIKMLLAEDETQKISIQVLDFFFNTDGDDGSCFSIPQKILKPDGQLAEYTLQIAASYNRLDVIKYLESKGVNLLANRNQALRTAVYWKQKDVASYLMQKWIDEDEFESTLKEKAM